MFFLVTGVPGAGKTINTIKFVNEEKQFKGREVYYHGIKDLDPQFGWVQMSDDDATNWHTKPSNSVFIFDEAYNLFPTKHGAQGTPDHVKALATHRHKGFDVLLITQKVSGQLDNFVKGLVNRHHHYARIMGSNNVNRFEWDVCQDNPNSPAKRKDANIKTIRFDKKYFGRYHSADEHTHTMSLPKGRIITLIACLIIMALVVNYVIDTFTPDEQHLASNTLSQQTTFVSSPSVEDLSYSELYTPELSGLPWTAPAYKEVIKPVTWPKPNCIHPSNNKRQCRCFTQQATLMDVSLDVCIGIVQDGYFDPTKPDSEHNDDTNQQDTLPDIYQSKLRTAELRYDIFTDQPDSRRQTVRRGANHER